MTEDEALRRALRIVGDVHNGDPAGGGMLLPCDCPDTRLLIAALAALVPDDQTPAQLLAWMHSDIDPGMNHHLCGTESGYARHVRSRPPTPACKPCKAAHSREETARAQRRKERAA